ncbi:recombinase family protein [Clostridium sp.]|uniref:recombinase family protein n=1 Tax=Clostridium sp. TaxID=1506 RepID=UPI0026392CAD|nr:recombinase family protein [Clostridium sp.]
MVNNSLNPRVIYIPAKIAPNKRIAIYCRVSTNHDSQEESLEAQIEGLKQIVKNNPKWNLFKVYTDKDSGGNTFRAGFQSMIFDSYENLIDIILVKSISRLARNTVDLLETVNKLRSVGIEMIFDKENIRTSEVDNDVLVAALTAIAQAESESSSESIKWGLKRGFESGKSKLYSRKCYGYKHNEKGALIIDEAQAEIVRKIFDLYLSGYSIGLIINELECVNIRTSRGKDKWSKRAIQTILTNEKYIGNVILGKTYTGEFPNNKQQMNNGNQEKYLMENSHEPIIELGKFKNVQEEMRLRSNIEILNGKVKRKGTHYSIKKNKV